MGYIFRLMEAYDLPVMSYKIVPGVHGHYVLNVWTPWRDDINSVVDLMLAGFITAQVHRDRTNSIEMARVVFKM